MWSLLGARGVDVVAFESFGDGWLIDIEKQLKLAGRARADRPLWRAARPRPRSIRRATPCSAGTAPPRASGCPTATGSPTTAPGLTLCDATSAAFAMDLPWPKLDVVTWSWQKVLGGEAQHGMLVLSPRAVERLEILQAGLAAAQAVPPDQGRQADRGHLQGRDDQHALDAGGRGRAGRAALGRGDRRAAGPDRPLRAQPRRHRRLGRAQRLGRVPRRVARDPLADLGLPRDPRRRLRGAVARTASRPSSRT